MNQQTYNALPGINNSGMKWLEKSPAHFKAWKEGRLGESSPAMELGIAIHCAVLEPDKFRDTYVALPDTSHLASPGQKAAMTKAAKKELAGSGKIALSFSDYNLVLNIFESVLVLSLSKGWRILTPNILSKNPSVNKLLHGMIKILAHNVNGYRAIHLSAHEPAIRAVNFADSTNARYTKTAR
jgi:hypothetical protein